MRMNKFLICFTAFIMGALISIYVMAQRGVLDRDMQIACYEGSYLYYVGPIEKREVKSKEEKTPRGQRIVIKEESYIYRQVKLPKNAMCYG